MKRLVRRLDLTGDVILIPGENKENLKELYQKTDLFVFPSLIENSPNILLEAMMAGAPVVTSNLAPMPEFCGNAAEYFNAMDTFDIARKIESTLENSDRLTDLRRRSCKQASKFSWDDFVSNVLQHTEVIASQNKN